MSNRQITIGACVSYGTIALHIAAGLLYTPWMIRMIGDSQYALYTLATSIIHIFLLDFGIGSAVTRFLSNYYAQQRYDEANRFMGIVYRVFLAISAVIALLLGGFYFLIDGVYAALTPEELQTFKYLFLIVGSYSVLSFPFTTFNGVLMANEQFVAVKACNFGQKLLDVGLIVAALRMGCGVYALVLVHAFSNVVFLAVKYWHICRHTTLRPDFWHWDGSTAKSLFAFSAWITLMSLAQRCMFNIMPTLIAASVGAAMVTVFSLAAALEGYVFSFADAINGMFMPQISRICVQGQGQEALSGLLRKVGRFHVVTIGLLYIGFVCVGRQFVDLWLGQGYEEVYGCALLLIFPSLIDAPQQVAKSALLVNGIVREQVGIHAAMAGINLVLAQILLPRCGILGAAAAICIAYLVRTALLNLLYSRRLLIDLKRYFAGVYGAWCGVAALTLGFGAGVRRIGLHGWSGLLVKCGLIAGVYAVLTYWIMLNEQEKREIQRKVRGVWGKGT